MIMKNHLESAIREKRNEYSRRYRELNPWTKYYGYAYRRKSQIGTSFNMKIADFKTLWFRHEAWKLKRPSIDRINPRKGYALDNCRFVEESLNKKLGSDEFVRRDRNRRLSRGRKCLKCSYITRSKYGLCFKHMGGGRKILYKVIPRI